MLRPAARSSLVALALVAVAPSAAATGMRRCEVHVIDGNGTSIAVGEATARTVRADEEVTVVAACTDEISVAPQRHTRRLEPPDLALTVASRCRGATGEGWDAPKPLAPLVPAPERAGAFQDRDASIWSYRGRLPSGRVQVVVSRADGVLVDVDGAAELPACAPPPPPPSIAGGGTTWTPPPWTPPPSPPPPEPRDLGAARWDDRRGVVWEIGGGPHGFYGKDPGLTVGGVVTFGVHWVAPKQREGSEKSGEIFPSVPETRWCVPIACAFAGALFMPSEVLLGNELGVDLRVSGDAEAGRAALRPVARASLGTLRTPSMFGFLAPEVGLRSTFGPRGTDFTVGWSLFPIEWRASGALVVGVEPLLATWRVGLDHRGGTGELSAGLTFRVAP